MRKEVYTIDIKSVNVNGESETFPVTRYEDDFICPCKYFYKDMLVGETLITDGSCPEDRKKSAKDIGITIYDKIILREGQQYECIWTPDRCLDECGYESTEFNIEL